MKEIAFEENLHNSIKKGLEKSVKLVGSTFGPLGKTVLIQEKNKPPFATKDGVTVAKYLEFVDKVENLSAQILKQAAESTNQTSGDGTTTTTILTESIYRFAKRELDNGVALPDILNELENAKDTLLEQLKSKAKNFESWEELRDIANISANGDSKIASLILEALESVGEDGSISIQDSNTRNTELEILEGFKIDQGLASSSLCTDYIREVAKLKNTNIFVTDFELTTVNQMGAILAVAQREGKPLAIFCSDISGEALAMLIINVKNKNINAIAVKGPRFGEERRAILNDLAIATGANIYSLEDHADFESVNIKHFGFAQNIESGKNNTIIIGGHGKPDDIMARINTLKQQIEEEENENLAVVLTERKIRISSGVALIKVGGSTTAQQKEIKARFEDAIEAIQAAKEEGIVIGGGCCWLYLDYISQENIIGMKILKEALQEPFKVILKNAYLSPELFLEKLKEFNNDKFGVDVRNKKVIDLFDSGIIDPYKTARCALENALSAVTVLLSSSSSIIEVDNN